MSFSRVTAEQHFCFLLKKKKEKGERTFLWSRLLTNKRSKVYAYSTPEIKKLIFSPPCNLHLMEEKVCSENVIT